jgi:hypothetical protein
VVGHMSSDSERQYALMSYDTTVAQTLSITTQYSAGYNVGMFGLAASTIPEPSTALLLVSGVIGLLAYAWRKRK